MKKNRLIRFPGLLKRFRKNLMFIKCCIVFIFVFSLNLSAHVFSQSKLVMEKPRDFDPFGHAGLSPLVTI